jgi:hypothetical protein
MLQFSLPFDKSSLVQLTPTVSAVLLRPWRRVIEIVHASGALEHLLDSSLLLLPLFIFAVKLTRLSQLLVFGK